jgi:D-apiose dehydrogenase
MKPFLIIESAIHQLDVMRYLFGEPTSLYARCQRVSPHVRGEDVSLIVLGYPGRTVLVERSYASKGYANPPILSERVAIEGTDGSAFLDTDGCLRLMRVSEHRDD